MIVLSLILGLIPFFSIYSAATPLIESVTAFNNKIEVVAHQSFADLYLRKSEFFVEYYNQDDLQLQNLPESINTIPFILCAIPAIWFSGKTYTIETMDKDLYDSLKKIQHVFKIFYPKFKWDGKLIPKKLEKNYLHKTKKKNKIGVLFSGGLDSVCTSFAHLDKQQLLLTIRGCDVPLGKTEKWFNVVDQVNEFAHTYGHEVAYIGFNFYGILNRPYFSRKMGNWWAKTSGSLSHAGLVAPLLYAKGYKHLRFASSNTIDCPRPFGNHPLIDNNLLFSSITVQHDGGTLTRPEKVQLIYKQAKKNNVPLPVLRVCRRDKDGRNCGNCFSKCLLTMNNILAAGYDYKDFGFDIALDDLITLTKSYFVPKIEFLKSGDLWDWQCSQKSLKKNRFFKSRSKKLDAYLQWFLQLRLDEYCKSNTAVYEKKKPFYAYLWQLAYTKDSENELLSIKPL